MIVGTMQETSITDETRTVVWRIFAGGASPLTARSPYELIAPIVSKHINSKDIERLIGEIQGWFESHGDRHWLKPDMREAVAAMILEGVGTAHGETQIWAVGSIDAEVATPIVRSLWSCEQIDSFTESALNILEKLCDRDHVLDPSRLERSYSSDARIPKDAIEREGRLETFWHLDNHGLDLVHRALYPAIGNLLALVVELRPERFESFIERLDHPVVQARTAHHMVAATRHLDHRATLRWIGRGSCNGLIALAIVHTLNSVNRLDDEIRFADHAGTDGCTLSTELRPPQDDLDAAAAGLLDGLVDRLSVLDPPVCARWVGELLSEATYVLHRHRGHEIPRRICELERKFTQLCARLFREQRSANLLPHLVDGLRHTPRISWTRHLAKIAWEIRDPDSARAAEIAGTALDEHERLIAEELERGHVFLEWLDWDHREWLSGLAVALAVSREELDLPCWVRTQCHSLALSVWDAEEDYSAFSSADRVVQHWFLVALHAIPVLIKLGRPVKPAAVRALAESLWAHCNFAGTHLHTLPDASVAAEHAARSAIEYGTPSDIWLLEQARNPDLGPRSLWALADQRTQKNIREGGPELRDDQIIADEFTRIASDRFGDGRQCDLETLRFWGLLWLLLGAVDEAEKTATAMFAFPLRAHDRGYKILALKLLAMVGATRPPAPALADFTASLYKQLWPGYTLPEEREDREQIDEMLKRPVFRMR